MIRGEEVLLSTRHDTCDFVVALPFRVRGFHPQCPKLERCGSSGSDTHTTAIGARIALSYPPNCVVLVDTDNLINCSNVLALDCDQDSWHSHSPRLQTFNRSRRIEVLGEGAEGGL